MICAQRPVNSAIKSFGYVAELRLMVGSCSASLRALNSTSTSAEASSGSMKPADKSDCHAILMPK